MKKLFLGILFSFLCVFVFAQNTANYTFFDANGKKVSLQNFKGKVVVIDVWASWCKPCVTAFPTNASIEEKMKDLPVVFLTIGTDKKKKKWKNAVRLYNSPGQNLWTGKKNAMLSDFNIESFPHYLLIDKQGKVVNSDMPSIYEGQEEIRKLARE